ncbi:MAG: hypothetical protein R3C55_08905 [Parvularculaceae bacterium]
MTGVRLRAFFQDNFERRHEFGEASIGLHSARDIGDDLFPRREIESAIAALRPRPPAQEIIGVYPVMHDVQLAVKTLRKLVFLELRRADAGIAMCKDHVKIAAFRERRAIVIEFALSGRDMGQVSGASMR